MDVLLSAVLGDLTSRSINFIISKYSKPQAMAVEGSLQRALLRAQVIIDEAMGRHISNQAMFHQLDMLRNTTYWGYYVLDTFRYQSQGDKGAHGQNSKHPLLLSKLNSIKDFCLSSRTSAQILSEMQEVLDCLSSMILDADQLVLFLVSYPCIYREPYSMHLLLSNCMFGRQMETKLIIDFLLDKQSHGAEGLEVLPIIGPARVGKRTLVAHVCKDERVRDYFSEILFVNDLDFTDDDLASFRERCASHMSNLNKERRLLIVAELFGDLNEDAWNGLYFASKQFLSCASKIIVTSRSDKIITFGTTQPLTLKHLSHEEYWYFFKTLTFGSMDPTLYPRHVQLAMDIAKTAKGSLIGANAIASLLRDNFDIHFWFKLWAYLGAVVQNNLSKFGEHPSDILNQKRDAHPYRMLRSSEEVVLYHQYECSSREVVPKIKLHDVMYGGVKPPGKFEVLAWKSRIPPYHSYICTCEIQELKTTPAKRKRSTEK